MGGPEKSYFPQEFKYLVIQTADQEDQDLASLFKKTNVIVPFVSSANACKLHIYTRARALSRSLSLTPRCGRLILATLDQKSLYFHPYTQAFIDEGVRTGGVLVHCFAGVSRSATCAASYLMEHHDMTARDAVSLVFPTFNTLVCPT
jgi:protein tyrosine phosphatase